MQRKLLISVISPVVAAILLVGGIVIGTHVHKAESVAAGVSPTPSASATEQPRTARSATDSPATTPAQNVSVTTPIPRPNATPTPAVTPVPTTHPARAVSSVNCGSSSDAKYCSAKDKAGIAQSAVYSPSNPSAPNYAGYPTISMHSDLTGNDKLHIVVNIENKTKATFHFPSREVDLVMTKDGAPFQALATHGAEFEMTPGGTMTATFDVFVANSGTYEWQAKTWYW